jgi:single-strand DNA-binding protein
MPPQPRPAQSGSHPHSHHNQVCLVGRVAAAPEVTQLPSGDEVVTWRLVVDRDGAQQAPYVDTLECAAWTARTRRSASGWQPGDIVSVDGALRRRFWRGPQGPRSRYEIEVSAVRRLERAS